MKKHLFPRILPAALIAIALTACSESDDSSTEFDNWQECNETYFSSLYQSASKLASSDDSEWKVYRKWSLTDMTSAADDDHIVVQVLHKGDGSGCPMFTDSVRVHYRGRLIPSESYAEGYVFDESFTGELDTSTAEPTMLAVSGLVNGFATALQKMHIGDRWKVYMPYTLGYGSSENNSIPAYSTLIFDITLVAYFRPNASIPDFQAKPSGQWVEE